MKILKYIPLIVVMLFIIFWGVSLIYNEILTLQHSNEFAELYKSTNMIDDVDYCKVIEYDKNIAKVYYVKTNISGDTIVFKNMNNEWKIIEWKTVWAKTGSADDFIWPYIYHSAKGQGILLFIGAPVILIAIIILVNRKKRVR